MARNNKYTSLNFNEIYEKKVVNHHPSHSTTSTAKSSSSSSSSSSYLSTATKSYSLSAASRLTHGGMVVLSRPSPKPQQPSLTPPLSPSPKQPPPLTPAAPSPSPAASLKADTDVISLRPQGKTAGGTNSSPSSHRPSSPGPVMLEKEVGSGSLPKSDKFVPPHLRHGYVAKEVITAPPPSHGPEFTHRPRSGNHRPASGQGYQYQGSPDNHRPGSGHGYQYHGSPDNHRPGSGHGYQYHGSPDNHRPGSGHGYQCYGSPHKFVENGRVRYGGGYQYQGSPDDYRPGSAHRFHENGRVNYGGGYGAGNPDPGLFNRPRSGGNRPSSSG